MNIKTDMDTKAEERLISTRGLVVEGAWDEMFNPVYLKLETFTERQYLIKMNQMGRRLLGKCGTVVDVVGFESTDEKGRRWISVNRFHAPVFEDEYAAETGLFVG